MTISLTIEQIAEIAQVSRSTVSRVLNDQPNVRAEVRDRVLRVMAEHHYAPRAAARSLASSRTHVLGLLIPRTAAQIFADPFFSLVIQGITEACTAHGYFLMLAMVTGEMEEGFYNRILRSRHFDGLIMLSSDLDDPILPLLIKDRLPLVLIGRHPLFENVSSIDSENREGSRLAVEHLLALGYQRIATITGPLQMAASVDRRDGYRQALLQAGVPVTADLMVESDFTQQGGYRAMRQLLELPQRPRAVFVAGDTMAVGAMHAVQEAGLRIPHDIALVGFDDLPLAAYTNPPMTTVHQPITEMGHLAVTTLIEQLDQGEDTPPTIARLPVRLAIRQSCGATVL